VPKQQGQLMQQDISDLRDEILLTKRGLSEQRARLAERLEEADERIQRVDGKIYELNHAARKTDAGLGVRMDEHQREIQELRGTNELLAYRLGQQEEQLKNIEALALRVTALENALPRDRAEKKSGKDRPGTNKKTAAKDKGALLLKGKKLLKEGKMEQCRGVLRDLIRRWPKAAGHTDEAYFNIGESYFRTKKYRSALQEYIRVIEEFGKGKLVDDAYYRIGSCMVQLGNLEDASTFYREIVENHPKSPLLAQAKAKLQDVQARRAKTRQGSGRTSKKRKE